MYQIKTCTGREITLTENHPLLTLYGWNTIKDLKIRDRIAVPRVLDFFGSKRMRSSKISLLAYILTEGCISQKNTIFISKKNKEASKYIKKCMEEFPMDNIAIYGNSGNHSINGKETRNWLNTLGLTYEKSADKFIPNEIFKLKEAFEIIFVCNV